jgi:hypothetical protein
MTTVERRATVSALKETVAVHDDAALSLMRAAQKHLRAARDLSARLEQLQRSPRPLDSIAIESR